MCSDSYLLSNDAASCWRSVGRSYRRKLTASQLALMMAATGCVLAEVMGDREAKENATGRLTSALVRFVGETAVALPSIRESNLPTYIRECMDDTIARAGGRRGLSRRPTRIRGRRTRAERRKR